MNAVAIIDHLPVLPEVILLAGACALMLFDLGVKSERRHATFWLAQAILLACALATGFVQLGTGRGLYIFDGHFVADAFANLVKFFCYVSTAVALVYSRQYLLERGLLKGEFFTLTLFSLLGMMVMASANSFLSLYLGLELMSLSLYAMVALNRDSVASTEAAMKYFILGALSSGLLLYGMSMIYGATGSLDFRTVSDGVVQLLAGAGEDGAVRPFLVFGVVFVVAGIAFKLGVVPFHMWIPDVYHGAPTPITLFIGTASKIAAFAMAIRLLVNGLQGLAEDWQQMLAIMAVLSMAIGNITAIAQSNLKRMLAYSAIAHMGFMLLGLLSGMVGGNTLSAEDAYSTALFYTAVYALMTLASFGIIIYLARPGFESDALEDMRGLSRRNPWAAFLMLVTMFSLAGIPPTVGFYAKLAVFSAAVAAGHVWLVVVAVLLSLVGAFYYLRVVKLMYFDEPKDAVVVQGSAGMRALLSANALLLLLLGLLPQSLMAWCLAAVQSLRML